MTSLARELKSKLDNPPVGLDAVDLIEEYLDKAAILCQEAICMYLVSEDLWYHEGLDSYIGDPEVMNIIAAAIEDRKYES